MNQDLEVPVQPSVAMVRKEVKEADALWIFTPEYNFSFPGVLKNLLDWLSRPMDMSNFQNPSAAVGKKVAISGRGGKNMTQSCRAKLTELLDLMKMELMHEPQTSIALGMEAWTKGFGGTTCRTTAGRRFLCVYRGVRTIIRLRQSTR